MFKDKYRDISLLIDDLSTSKLIFLRSQWNVVSKAMYYNYKKSVNLLKSISILCFEGYANEAIILFRSLLNIYISTKWISMDKTEERSQRYVDFELVYRRKFYEKVLEYGTPPHENTEALANNENQVNQTLLKYNIKDINDVRSWHGTTIKKMAYESGLHWEYDVFYSYLSEFEHTGPASITEYWDGFNIQTNPREKNVVEILLQTIEYFLLNSFICCKHMGCSYRMYSFCKIKLDELVAKYLKEPDWYKPVMKK
jgi:hypothetical protein